MMFMWALDTDTSSLKLLLSNLPKQGIVSWKPSLNSKFQVLQIKKPALQEKNDLRASFLRHASTKQNQNNKLSEEW